MLERSTAREARDHILEAIQHINHSLLLVQGQFPDATFQEMKRAAGTAIGGLDVDYLCRIFELFPDLDDVERVHRIDHLGKGRSLEEPK